MILLGEHAVNRGADALVAAVGPRTACRLTADAGGRWRLEGAGVVETADNNALEALRHQVDELRSTGDSDAIAALVRDDFLAPVRYALGLLEHRESLGGGAVVWSSQLSVGAGLGSGAAATAALAVAHDALLGRAPQAERAADLAWQADVVAHGGTASALDASGAAYGGVVRFGANGPVPVSVRHELGLLIADTGVKAPTAAVNAEVRRRLHDRPALAHVFRDVHVLVEEAVTALERGDLRRLGTLMTLNQLLLRRIGVSAPENDALVEAALDAGALGAKLSGSGGGGIILALALPEQVADVLRALRNAGARAWQAEASPLGATVPTGDINTTTRSTS